MLTRKALIVHCVTSPPLRHSTRFGRTVAQRKRGTDWRMTLNLHLAKQKIFKHSSKMFSRQKGRKCFFVVAFCGVFVVVMTMQNGGRHGSLIILIVSKALVRIGQSGLDVE